MKKTITLGMWLDVFFGGIWQFIKNIFSWKNKTPFWRVIWAIITICLLALTTMFGYDFYYCYGCYHNEELESQHDMQLSRDFKFRNNSYNEGSSYIYDSRTKKKIINEIEWIAVPEYDDSLIIVAKDGKRGFVNRYTAKTVIPFKYDAAWFFYEGTGAVCEGDSVFFIDHSGTPLFNRKFARKYGYDSYAYHGNYAAIPVNDKYGLIDKSGEWVLLPEYDNIHIGSRNMWYVSKNDKWGVIGTNGEIVIPIEYQDILIESCSGVIVTHDDNLESRYGYDGSLIDKFVFDWLDHLSYPEEKDGETVWIEDDMWKYGAGGGYGLMTKAGIPVTPPLYSEIESVAPGIYKCGILRAGECILIDRTGKKINE